MNSQKNSTFADNAGWLKHKKLSSAKYYQDYVQNMHDHFGLPSGHIDILLSHTAIHLAINRLQLYDFFVIS